jgi:hypothetical protein
MHYLHKFRCGGPRQREDRDPFIFMDPGNDGPNARRQQSGNKPQRSLGRQVSQGTSISTSSPNTPANDALEIDDRQVSMPFFYLLLSNVSYDRHFSLLGTRYCNHSRRCVFSFHMDTKLY